nr:MAG TPA: hypothetical protein [Caudoviricetes sp.]
MLLLLTSSYFQLSPCKHSIFNFSIYVYVCG